MNEQRYREAATLLEQHFGLGRQQAIEAVYSDPVAKKIYDCAIRAIAEGEKSAIEMVREELEHPIGREEGYTNPDYFDPWRPFERCIYGSYSSDFDDMAILVLDNIVNKRWGASAGEGLAHEMFREMLCVADLCDYGTSPRGCFPNWSIDGIEELLVALLEKWREYRRVQWEH